MKRTHTIRILALSLALSFAVPAKAFAVQTTALPPGSSSGQSAVAEPQIQAEGAVVIDARTGDILYGKNEKKRFYPASTTKLMTAMLTLEHTNLNDTVTFSKAATTNLEAGASTLKLTEGDKLTVEQCLYGLLLKSANEIGNGLAEHIAGSVDGFAELMNQKAAALGCTGTHFANPHGLNNSNHYTTPYDMALIARAAFQNETLCKIDTTTSYQFPAIKKSGAVTITMGHKMMYPTDSRYYEGIIGGKTGYTSLAGNTLVTGAERNGIRLIAVIMKSKATHYTDTKALLDYGFAVTQSVPAGSPPAQNLTGPGVMNGSGPSGTAPQPAPAVTGWIKDEKGWYYIKSDGTWAAGEWLNLNQKSYWIDPNGYMATGWRQFTDGKWYYFRSDGSMASDYWAADNGKWFYLGSQGFMLLNTRTPDGYVVGSDGAWLP
ncbi:MAG: D-alanyl-D-alanine carboxypeptidase [Hungatella sp.]|nr:D-alanyl-D-alanine carboxypeptidase [Hungatella sp.]